jgi:hypothetical protein
LTITGSNWNGDYFSGVPVTLKAIANNGYAFSHWTGASNSTNSEIELYLDAAATITAFFVVSP